MSRRLRAVLLVIALLVPASQVATPNSFDSGTSSLAKAAPSPAKKLGASWT
jgi:hypothetical protein